MSVVPSVDVAAVRRFTRFYTRAIGVLQERLHGQPLTLTEARTIYEIANRNQPTASALTHELGLDAGYLSRILKGLENRNLIARAPHPADARQALLSLTAEGQQHFRAIDMASQREVGVMLANLSPSERQRLIRAMHDIEQLLARQPGDTGAQEVVLRKHRVGDIGHVISRHGTLYADEYGWDITFEALVAKVAGEFVDRYDPASDCCWIAEHDSEILGSAFVVRKDRNTAKLRLVYVEPAARGLGLGRRLVEACIKFAQDAGYSRMTLWTNDILVPARRLYQALGFEMTASEPHHSFGVDLIGETWERDL